MAVPTQPAASLDDALQSVTLDDALSAVKPEDVQGQQATPSGGPSVFSSNTDEAITASGQQVAGVLGSMATGAAKAGMELKDFVFGEPDANDKWAVRQWIEDKSKGLRQQSTANAVAESITQFGVGFIGLGKVGKGVQTASKVAHWAEGAIRGAIAGGVFMDPHEERLSNLVQSYPALQNPVSAYLAAKPEDSAAEGRLKNALEGVVMDVGLAGALALATKSVKLLKAGDTSGANEAAAQADQAFIKAGNFKDKFFDHEEFVKQQEMDAATRADEALRVAGQSDDQGAGVKNFLGEPAAPPPGPLPREAELGGPSSDVLTPEQKAVLDGHGLPQDVLDSARGLDLKAGGPVMDARQGPSVGVDAERHAMNLAREAAGNLDIQKGGPTMMAERGPTSALRDRPEDATIPEVQSGGAGNDAVSITPVGGGTADVQPRLGPTDVGAGAPDTVRPGGRAASPRVDTAPPVSAEDVEQALGHLKKDNDALVTYGGRDAAIEEGYRFKGDDGPNGVIPWQKLRTTDETQAWMGQVMDQQASIIAKARGGNAEGVLTDKAVDAMVQQRAKVWNENPEVLRGILQAAGKDAPELAANMETSFLIANKAYQDAYELAVRVNAGNFEGFGSRAEAVAALQNRMGQATAMYANGKAIASNAARGLRRMRGAFRFSEADIHNIQTSDPEAILKLVTETGGDPAALAKAGRLNLVQRILDPLASLQAANLLWGWKTQVVNFATSAAQLVWRPLETGFGSTALKAWGALRGDEELIANARSIRQQSVREVTYLASTLSDGLAAATKAFLDGDSVLLPHAQEHFNAASMKADNLADLAQAWKPLNTMDDVVSNAMTAGLWGKAVVMGPLRALGAADELVKTMRYRAIVMSKASLEAEQRGLTGQAAKDFVSSKVDASFDDLGRGIDQSAVAEAQSSTFQQGYISSDMGHFGAMAQGYANFSATVPVLRLLTPFVKTPTNLFRYSVKLTPGMNLLQKEYSSAISGALGVEAQARAVGQMMLGTMLTSTAAMMWMDGRLTGSGPQDYDQKKQWMAQGSRPFAISWTNDKGEKQFFELSRFDPIGMPITLVADAMNLMLSGKLRPEEETSVAMAPVIAFAHLTKDKTYLKNLSDALAAFGDDKKMEGLIRRALPGFMPFSSLLGSINPDPVLHEVRHWYDGMLAKTPGWSNTLAPQRDFLGDPIVSPQGFVSTAKNQGPLMDTLNESFALTGRYLEPPAPRNANTGGVDLRDFNLADGRTAYDRYQELAGHPKGGGGSLKDTLTSIVQSDGFKALPHGGPTEKGTKAGTIMDVVKKYREGAWKTLLAESPELRKAVTQRKLDIGKAVAVGAKDVRAVGDQARMGTINNLLKGFGVSLPTVNLPSQQQ